MVANCAYRMAPFIVSSIKESPLPLLPCFESRRTWPTLSSLHSPSSFIAVIGGVTGITLDPQRVERTLSSMHATPPLYLSSPKIDPFFPNVSNACKGHVFEILASVLIAQTYAHSVYV